MARFSYTYAVMQKLASRQVALEKSAKDKERWRECLTEDLISSEDSKDDGSFLVRPLPWRSEKVTSFFSSLDRKQSKRKSRKSKMMMMARKEGQMSERPKPPPGSLPTWALRS